MVDDGLAAVGQVAAGGEVHHRVGAVALRPVQLLDFLRRCCCDTGEAPMLALILVVIMRPMPVGSSRFGRAFAAQRVGGASIARLALRDGLVDPVARVARCAPGWPIGAACAGTAARRRRRAAAAPPLPARWRTLAGITRRPRATSSRDELRASRPRARATRRISGVMMPLRAASSCVIALPSAGMTRIRFEGSAGPPAFSAAGSGRLPQRFPGEHGPANLGRQGSCPEIQGATDRRLDPGGTGEHLRRRVDCCCSPSHSPGRAWHRPDR